MRYEQLSSDDWEVKMNNELIKLPTTLSAESRRWANNSIYKIPSSEKQLFSRSSAYQPQMVAIGPYHCDEDSLEGMEEHKQRALLTFLKRSMKPLQGYLDALAEVVEDLKDAYSRLQARWRINSAAFLRMMILDGCFLLEIMRTTTGSRRSARKMGYVNNDPLFSDHGKLWVPYLKRDMLMLENQLPLLVLARLLVVEYDAFTLDSVFKELTVLILKFFSQSFEADLEQYEGCAHILDIYRKTLVMRPNTRIFNRLRPTKEHCYVRSATELAEAGIRFEKSETRSINNISFHHGVLKLPLIVVDDGLESAYLNLMAFERFHAGAGKKVTSYVFFMDNIINSERDVGLLRSCGILQNALSSDKAVADIFNSLARYVNFYPDDRLDAVHTAVSDYCRMLVPRWMAYAKHNYCKNPWVSISILAAVSLFALTGIQTVYSVLSYYAPSK